MSIKPMVRSNLCINAHPTGCAAMVDSWIKRVQAVRPSIQSAAAKAGKSLPKNVLVLGCSTGYGLASRIAAAFGCGAGSIGVSFERDATDKKPGSPGWYNNREFDRQASLAGMYSKTLNMDAFSNEARAEVIRLAKEQGLVFDQVVYSLASPVRTDPATGIMHKSVLKPLGKPFTGRSVDVMSGAISEISVEPGNDQEIADTVKVMGGEDWELWLRALTDAGLLAKGCVTLAYSYIGPEHTWAVYRDGTIGKAKAHLETTAKALDGLLAGIGGKAYVSIDKAVVTRSSSVIPVVSLYIAALFKAMKQLGLHEDCQDQMIRLYRDRLMGTVPTDEAGRIRLDDWEMRPEVQELTSRFFNGVTEANLSTTTDFEGFRKDFLQIHGFDVPGVDYEAEVAYL
ncbi:MAG: trans-2-enoyl-CoA reductase [Spirochaetes bacterium RIFOXYC1_FULL_54_7]|nr:MAG: trans-2-enoyl-CoA reductase [Spirochaetes bacterium RIFOXYC1_FULL_54_7]